MMFWRNTVTKTLGMYMSRRFLLNFLGLMGVLLLIIFVFDAIELLRRASKREDIPLSLVLEMAVLKLPDVGQIILPFAVMFGAMLTFWQLSRKYELVVIRAAGFSVWQFITPLLLAAAILGIVQMAVINPLGSALLSRFAQLEQSKLRIEQSPVALFKGGLWLRQPTPDGYVILHAEKILPQDWSLQNVMALQFDNEDKFLRRIDSPTARLEPGQWVFTESVINELAVPRASSLRAQAQFSLPTSLSRADVENSFAAPETVSFWDLPERIRTMTETGFAASRLKVHFYHLMAQPLMLMAMILLAASVAMRPPRERGGMILLAAGIGMGFVIFFLSAYLQALGASRELPPMMAAWAPALICTLGGLGVLMMTEDG